MKTIMRPLDEIIAKIDDADASPKQRLEDDSNSPGETLQYIKFMLDDFIMAAPIKDTLEIGRHPVITALPNLPGWILGISNVRGEIVSMVDLKAFFKITPVAARRNSRFIILHNPVFKVGVTVDRIIGIFSYPQVATDECPSFEPETSSPEKAGWADYIQRIIPQENDLLNVLDIKRLLDSPQMNAFLSK